MQPKKEPLADGNIQLDYRISVMFLPEAEMILYADGAEVFVDEHGIQWIKFWPKNGYSAGKEHVVRTDKVLIVRES